MKRLFIGLMLAATVSAETLKQSHDAWTNQLFELKTQVAQRKQAAKTATLIDREEYIRISDGVAVILRGAEKIQAAEKRKDYVEACYIGQELTLVSYQLLLALTPNTEQSKKVENIITTVIEPNLELVCVAGIQREGVI
jgi:hypothetical protein